MPPADAPDSRAQSRARPARAENRRRAGRRPSVEAIAEKRSGLTRKRVETMLRDELRRRWVAPAEDYARLQIARLEAMAAKLAAIGREAGDLPAIDRVLKILDRLDRYHGFGRLTPATAAYEGKRENDCSPSSTRWRAHDPGAEGRRVNACAKAGRSRARRAGGAGRAAPAAAPRCCATSARCSSSSPAERAKLLAGARRQASATRFLRLVAVGARPTSGRRQATGSIG